MRTTRTVRSGALALGMALAACAAGGEPVDIGEQVEQVARIVAAAGDAAVRLKVTALVREKAPALLPLLDKNGDQIIEAAELLNFAWDDPNALMLLYLTIEALR